MGAGGAVLGALVLAPFTGGMSLAAGAALVAGGAASGAIATGFASERWAERRQARLSRDLRARLAGQRFGVATGVGDLTQEELRWVRSMQWEEDSVGFLDVLEAVSGAAQRYPIEPLLGEVGPMLLVAGGTSRCEPIG